MTLVYTTQQVILDIGTITFGFLIALSLAIFKFFKVQDNMVDEVAKVQDNMVDEIAEDVAEVVQNNNRWQPIVERRRRKRQTSVNKPKGKRIIEIHSIDISYRKDAYLTENGLLGIIKRIRFGKDESKLVINIFEGKGLAAS